MEIVRTQSFIKDYRKLTSTEQKQLIKQLKLLLQNSRYPSLGIRKIRGTPNIFEGRVSKSCRFTFRVTSDFLIMRRVGDHDKVLKNP